MIPEDLQNGDIPGLQDGNVQMTKTQPYHHPSREADMSTGVTSMIPQGLQNIDVPGLHYGDVQMTETQPYHPSRKADMSSHSRDSTRSPEWQHSRTLGR